ncbi:MAG TPA: alpha-glucan family phosphorylase [Bryobacteraceae bacterium]
MPKVHRFHVSPCLSERLCCLNDLSLNLRWSWDHPTIELFRRLDSDLWEQTNHNPWLMLGKIDQKRLVEVESDEAFLTHMDRVWAGLHDYLQGKGWFRRAHPEASDVSIAYFSAEFGLTECIPNYAGGLGILSGDHLKSASDLGLPLTGIGLLYQGGYFRQYLNADGWQQETYPINDFHNLPLEPVKDDSGDGVFIDVDLPGRKVYAQIWKVQVGRIPLYLLDTNLERNSPGDRKITGALYGGDRELRIQQEIVLGIGGIRALRTLGIRPTVCHMNEGHSAFLGPERARLEMEDLKLSYYEARQLSASGNVFTTHTPVPAGFDRFDPGLMDHYFRGYVQALGLSFDEFMRYGRDNQNDPGSQFNMANLAARHSSYANGVSRLHGKVTREMAQHVWNGYPLDEVPIDSVTNGIHVPTWISKEMSELLDRYLGPKWSEDPANHDVWNRIDRIPDHELWRVHQIRRERLVNYARARLADQLRGRGGSNADIAIANSVLDPDALTLGFARRFATYKRATLLLRDAERLKKLLNDPKRPLQILLAGKSHPSDNFGKELIRQILHFANDPQVRARVVFLEDYDMSVARYMVQGCDVWLNTPRRPNEASGTSGMKLLPNGGLNLSILDGWWDEAYNREVGWAIGSGEVYADIDYQDRVESDALFSLLEKEVIPLFYDRDGGDVPIGWLTRMKASIKRLTPVFNTNRMVAEYAERFYLPASLRHLRLKANHGERVRSLVDWRRRLRDYGAQVKVVNVEHQSASEIFVGSTLSITARIHLGQLSPADVRVQIYHGAIDPDGRITGGRAVDLSHSGTTDADHLYTGQIACDDSGSRGFAVRVIAHHDDAILPYEHPWLIWQE